MYESSDTVIQEPDLCSITTAAIEPSSRLTVTYILGPTVIDMSQVLGMTTVHGYYII